MNIECVANSPLFTKRAYVKRIYKSILKISKRMQRPRINLFPNKDKDGATYYIGRMKFPGTLNLNEGMAFIFYPYEDYSELHFCSLDSQDISNISDYSKNRRKREKPKHGNLPIELHKRKENNSDQIFYIGKIKVNINIQCANGVVFLVFIADENEEELQIATVDPDKFSGPKKQSSPEIYRKR